MGASFSYYGSFNKNPNLSKDQVEALFTPVLDMAPDFNLNFHDEDDSVSYNLDTYCGYYFIGMFEEALKDAVLATMDPSQPTQIVYNCSDNDAGNQYIYLSHEPIKALKMELFDVEIEIKNLNRRKLQLEAAIAELEIKNG